MTGTLTSAGLDLPRHEDVLAEIDAAYLADTGLDLDSANPDNAKQLLVRLNGYLADQLVSLAELVQTIYDATDPDTAEGVQASNLARIVGVKRKLGSRSTVTLVCAGVDGTLIREGLVVQGGTSDPLARWASTSDVVISGGTASVVFEAEAIGATTAEAGTSWLIITPVSGWSSASNAAAASVGTDEETDQALLQRRRLALGARAGCGIPGIRARLLALDFVQTAVVLANGENETRDINGVSMAPNSYLAVVLPDQLTADQERQILSVLYDSSLATSFAVGSIEGTVVDGVEWPVAFDYGVDVTVPIAYTVTLRPGVSEADARVALASALDGLWPLVLGETLTRLRLLALAYDTGLVVTAAVLIQGVDADLVPEIRERVADATVTVNGIAA